MSSHVSTLFRVVKFCAHLCSFYYNNVVCSMWHIFDTYKTYTTYKTSFRHKKQSLFIKVLRCRMSSCVVGALGQSLFYHANCDKADNASEIAHSVHQSQCISSNAQCPEEPSLDLHKLEASPEPLSDNSFACHNGFTTASKENAPAVESSDNVSLAEQLEEDWEEEIDQRLRELQRQQRVVNDCFASAEDEESDDFNSPVLQYPEAEYIGRNLLLTPQYIPVRDLCPQSAKSTVTRNAVLPEHIVDGQFDD